MLGDHYGLQTLLGDKMTLSGGILEGDMGKLKNNLIIIPKCIGPCPGFVTGLPLGKHCRILGPYSIVVSVRDNSSKSWTVKVSLVNLEEIRNGIIHIPSQVLQAHCVPGEISKSWSHDVVQVETLYSIMGGQVRFKIMNML